MAEVPHSRLARFSRVLVAALAAALLLLVNVQVVQAWTGPNVLCGDSNKVSPASSYEDCGSKGYSSAGYEAHSGTTYWGQDTGHNCTNYVAYRISTNNPALVFGPTIGNSAKDWGDYFTTHGYPPDSNPTVGAIAWYKAFEGGVTKYGHVAYVEKVNADGSIVVSEDNSGGNFDWRTVTRTKSWPSGFIHLADRPAALPSQPSGPRVTSTSGSTATLSWGDASNNETDFVSQYRIGTGGWVAGPTVAANSTSMTISGLASGTSYTFQVGARNAAGTRWSAYFYGTTVSLPAEPTSPRVTSTSGSTATLSWGDASNNETDFVSQYRIGTGAWVAGPTVAANSTSMTISGLASGTSYTFQVGARNAAGTRWSAYFSGMTPQVLPAEPTNPRVESTGGSWATVAWGDASNNETDFVSQYRIGTGGWVAGPTVAANSTSMTISGLASGTSHTFQVGARNAAGTRWSAYFYGTTVSLPAEPTSPRVTSTSGSTATLSWGDASNNETDFVSQYRIGTGAWVAGPTVAANSTSMTISGLASGTSYTFQVGARNAAGTRWSAYFSGMTLVPPPPPAYHTGRQVTVDSHANGGVSGHEGPGDSYAAGPTHAVNSPLWIVCYVTGQTISGPYGSTSIWDLSDDGFYYTDAWLYTGSNGAVVPPCALRTVTIDSHATGGVSGHTGPDNAYATGPTRPMNSSVTIACYVDGQPITGPYGTTTIWDLADDGYFYTDAWLYTGSNGAVVRHC